ncbi:MAG: HD domain-containing protein [Acidobacteria bacterium]|nr:HD domain-containing protein [Acidobacteriota bacterium]
MALPAVWAGKDWLSPLQRTESPRSGEELESVLMLSGSCSAVTLRQIQHLRESGCVLIPLDVYRLLARLIAPLCACIIFALCARRSLALPDICERHFQTSTQGHPMTEALAAIDIGTNSFHLVVVKLKDSDRFEILAQEKEVVRLGSGSKDMKYLKDDAMDRGIEALKRFRQIAEISQADIRAVATSAVREAVNKDDFLKRVKQEAGIEVEVISGFEEARLIYLGVLQTLPIFDKKVLLVDIGGGSTEFLIGQAGAIIDANSLKLGAIRLTDRFFKDEPVDPRSVNKCREHVKAYINPMARRVRLHGFETAVGSSGTILSIAQMVQILRKQEPTRSLSNFVFSRFELAEVIKMLVKADTVKKRQKIEGLDPKRADIILGGAIVLEQAFEEMKVEQMTVSGFALREGVILDALQKSRGGSLHQLTDIRYKGVLHLAETCHYEKEHSDQVTKLALQLYDQLGGLHKLDDINREYLQAAGILHNVGFFISHAQHHRHSYYIIRNSEYLTGFNSREVEIIAQVARYHRKSDPKLKHEEFARLSLKDQMIVRKLAGILRIADALNRTHASIISSLRCELDGSVLQVHLETAQGAVPSLEIYTADVRKGLLEEVLGVKVEFRVDNLLDESNAAAARQTQAPLA